MDGIEFRLSTNSNKKYMARPINRQSDLWTHFGAKNYQQFHDRIGYYSSLDHHNANRRRLYKLRHKAILTANNRRAYTVKYSPSWYSWHYLW